MTIKTFKKSNPSHPLEGKIKDSQLNLYEFTLMATKHVDFSTFDVLSVTRADGSAGYTCNTFHRKVNTQAARVTSQNAQIIPWPKKS